MDVRVSQGFYLVLIIKQTVRIVDTPAEGVGTNRVVR